MEGTFEEGRVHERKVFIISQQVVKKKSNCPQVKIYTLCKMIVTIENSRLDCD